VLQKVGPVHETAPSSSPKLPAAAGLATMVQAVPFHCSMTGAVLVSEPW